MAEVTQHSGPRKGRPLRASTRIDMTPMVDLGFLLITFFMLASAFSKPRSMEINMPVKNTPKKSPVKVSDAMTLILGENNKVYYFFGLPEKKALKTTDFSVNGLRKALTARKKENAKTFVLVKISDAARYKNVVDVIDEMAIAGVSQYAIADFTEADNFFKP